MRSAGPGAMVLSAFLVRVTVIAFTYRAISAPSADFHDFAAEMGWVARSIAIGKGFSSPFLPITGPTALMPPLFPYLLSGVFRVFGLYTAASAVVILLLDSVLSALTCVPIVLASRRTAGAGTASLAGWIWVLYPFAIYYSAAKVWDYALTAFLFAWAFYFVLHLQAINRRRAWFWVGLVCGLTTLSNPSVLLVLCLLILVAAWRKRLAKGSWLRLLGIAGLAFSLVVTPWILHVHRSMHIVVPVRDGFWLEFWAGNHGDTSDTNPGSAHPASNPDEMKLYTGMGEVKYLRSKRDLGLAYVNTHPVAFVAVSLRRFLRFWTGFWSFDPVYLQTDMLDIPNVFNCTAITFFMLIGVKRLLLKDPESGRLYSIVLLVFPVTYYLTHSSVDYREPIEPLIVQLVAFGAIPIVKKVGWFRHSLRTIKSTRGW